MGTSCDNNEGDAYKVTFEMTAIIKDISDRIEVEVIDSDYAFGTYWIIIFDGTKYYNMNDEEVSKKDLSIEDKIIITYNGQVMMSYPPQVAALELYLI
jgi:hypothetical protein